MATIKEFLTWDGFNWDKGIIVIDGKYIQHDDPILYKEFDDGFGCTECRPYIAKDDKKIYFVDNYDGAQSPQSLWLDLSEYVGENAAEIPVPGGG